MNKTQRKSIFVCILSVSAFFLVIIACICIFSLHSANKSLKAFVDNLENAKKTVSYKKTYQNIVKSNSCCFYHNVKSDEKTYESGILIADKDLKTRLKEIIEKEKFDTEKISEFTDKASFIDYFNIDIGKLKKTVNDVGFFTKIGLFLQRNNQFKSYLSLVSAVICTSDLKKFEQKICYINIENNIKVSFCLLYIKEGKVLENEKFKYLEFQGHKSLSTYKTTDFLTFLFYSYCTSILKIPKLSTSKPLSIYLEPLKMFSKPLPISSEPLPISSEPLHTSLEPLPISSEPLPMPLESEESQLSFSRNDYITPKKLDLEPQQNMNSEFRSSSTISPLLNPIQAEIEPRERKSRIPHFASEQITPESPDTKKNPELLRPESQFLQTMPESTQIESGLQPKNTYITKLPEECDESKQTKDKTENRNSEIEDEQTEEKLLIPEFSRQTGQGQIQPEHLLHLEQECAHTENKPMVPEAKHTPSSKQNESELQPYHEQEMKQFDTLSQTGEPKYEPKYPLSTPEQKKLESKHDSEEESMRGEGEIKVPESKHIQSTSEQNLPELRSNEEQETIPSVFKFQTKEESQSQPEYPNSMPEHKVLESEKEPTQYDFKSFSKPESEQKEDIPTHNESKNSLSKPDIIHSESGVHSELGKILSEPESLDSESENLHHVPLSSIPESQYVDTESNLSQPRLYSQPSDTHTLHSPDSKISKSSSLHSESLSPSSSYSKQKESQPLLSELESQSSLTSPTESTASKISGFETAPNKHIQSTISSIPSYSKESIPSTSDSIVDKRSDTSLHNQSSSPVSPTERDVSILAPNIQKNETSENTDQINSQSETTQMARNTSTISSSDTSSYINPTSSTTTHPEQDYSLQENPNALNVSRSSSDIEDSEKEVIKLQDIVGVLTSL